MYHAQDHRANMQGIKRTLELRMDEERLLDINERQINIKNPQKRDNPVP